MKEDFSSIVSQPLASLSDEQWEALCDHCGRCCLLKLENEETDEVFYTNIICHLYDLDEGRCCNYSQRKQKVVGCVDIKKFGGEIYSQLPETCAYRLRYNNLPLPDWHPLVAGGDGKMQQAMKHIKYRAISEEGLDEKQFEDHIVNDIK